jgi:putative Mg2+ transporter-C (MgtC) family protein
VEPLDWSSIADVLAKIGIAYVLALPVAWEREQQGRSAGLRTFPLVATAATAFILIARAEYAGHDEAHARVLEGLITGIGFIGGGAILRDRAGVHGTSTAASIWATAAIGAATAYGRYEIALVLSVIVFATLRGLARFKAPEGSADGEGD